MAFDIPSSDDLINGLDAATELTNQYVVAPLEALGISGFAFTTRGEIKSELKSQISSNYNEKNIALQDTISLAPEIFTLSGYVGEVFYKTTKPKLQGAKSVAQQLTVIAGYLPTITASVKQLQNSVQSSKDGLPDYLDAALGSGIDLYQTFQKLNPPPTEQAKAYNFFKALRKAKTLVSFDTPFGFQSNYAILDVLTIQPENTETKSDIVLVLHEMRFATTKTVPFDPLKYQGRSIQQNSPVTNKGSTQGSATGQGLSGLLGNFSF